MNKDGLFTYPADMEQHYHSLGHLCECKSDIHSAFNFFNTSRSLSRPFSLWEPVSQSLYLCCLLYNQVSSKQLKWSLTCGTTQTQSLLEHDWCILLGLWTGWKLNSLPTSSLFLLPADSGFRISTFSFVLVSTSFWEKYIRFVPQLLLS